MLKHTVKLMLLPAAAAVLVACGGGGGGSSHLRVGQFVDDPVEGLTYQCVAPNSTASPSPSVTNAQGQFNYADGQVCTFRVGNVVLGSPVAVPSDGLVTPQDVAGVVRTATSAPSVTTIAQFLQSLSEPGVSGKLKISSATTEALSKVDAVQLVSSTGPLNQEKLGSLVVQTGKTLISPTQAAINLSAQLDKLGVSRTVGAVTASAPPNVLYLSVSSPLASIAAGATLKLTATANMSNGDNSVVSGAVTWSSANSSLATVSADGTVTTLKPGLVKLTASNGNQSAVFELSITDAVLQSLSVPTGVGEPLPLGLTRSLALTGKYSDGSEKTLSSGVTWTVSNDKASVDASGVVTAKGIGDVVVTGTIAGVSRDIPLTVSGAVLQSFVVSRKDDSSAPIAVGRTVELRALGKFSDNSSSDISKDVTWTSSNDNVAVLGGVVTTQKIGNARISARSGNLTADMAVDVGPAELVSLAISTPEIKPEGLNQNLVLTGTYTDKTTATNLVNVTWSSADTSKVTVSTNGNVVGKGVGSAKVTAMVGGVSADVTVTVTDPVAKSLTVSSALQTIVNGASAVINAMATLTNDAVVAVAKSVNWVVESLGGQAVIDIAGDTVSLRGTSPGEVKVKGDYQGIFANFNVTVTPVLSGTAAVGAPLRAATIEVYDLQGQLVAQTQTDQSGKYQVQIPTSAKGPFIIKAIYADEALFSVYSGQGGVANISHLTDAVTAMLSPTGASDGFLLRSQSSALLTESNISEAVSKLNAAMSPARAAILDMPVNANFMSTAFDANGTGIDRLLDTASVTVTAKNVNNQNAANIGVAFNVAQGLNAMNAARYIAFDSTQSASTIRTRASSLSVSVTQLPPTDIGQMYNDLLDRLNACYAIPLAQRVSGNNITHQNCKDVFFNSDPSQYKDGGFNARQRFTSMFTAPGPVRFTPTLSPIIAQDLQGAQSTGTALVANKGEDNLGNFAYNRFYVKKFTLNGRDVLGVVGDQNDFEFYVNSENEHRSFPMSTLDLDLVQSQFALILRLPDAARVNATAAVVEGPGGRFLMAPLTGRDNFRLCRQLAENEVTPVSISQAPTCANKPPLLVYAARFVNQQIPRSSSSVSNLQSPLEFDYINNDFFVVKRNGVLLPDSEIENIPNGATWKATVFFSNGSKRELFTHNTSRPMTAQELMGADSPINRAAKLTSMTMSEGPGTAARTVDFSAATPLRPNVGIPVWAQRSSDAYRRGQDAYTPAWAPVDGGFQFRWSVSQGQIAPFIAFMSGQVRIDWEGRDLPRVINNVNKLVQPMEDQVRFAVGRREVTLFCTPTPFITTPNDESCDLDLDTNTYSRDANNQYRYNPGARMTSTSLISRDQQQRSIIRGYQWFIPTAGGSDKFVQAQ